MPTAVLSLFLLSLSPLHWKVSDEAVEGGFALTAMSGRHFHSNRRKVTSMSHTNETSPSVAVRVERLVQLLLPALIQGSVIVLLTTLATHVLPATFAALRSLRRCSPT